MILRLRSVLDTLTREYSGQSVLIIGHQVIVNCFRYLFERMTEAQILAIDREGDVPNCGVTFYEFDAAGGAKESSSFVLRKFHRSAGRRRRLDHDRVGHARRAKVMSKPALSPRRALRVTPALLARWPLPAAGRHDDKDDRGRF